jgi:hypothetical protein
VKAGIVRKGKGAKRDGKLFDYVGGPPQNCHPELSSAEAGSISKYVLRKWVKDLREMDF